MISPSIPSSRQLMPPLVGTVRRQSMAFALGRKRVITLEHLRALAKRCNIKHPCNYRNYPQSINIVQIVSPLALARWDLSDLERWVVQYCGDSKTHQGMLWWTSKTRQHSQSTRRFSNNTCHQFQAVLTNGTCAGTVSEHLTRSIYLDRSAFSASLYRLQEHQHCFFLHSSRRLLLSSTKTTNLTSINMQTYISYACGY